MSRFALLGSVLLTLATYEICGHNPIVFRVFYNADACPLNSGGRCKQQYGDEATGKAVNGAGNSGCLKAQNHQPTKTSTVYSYVFRED